MSLVQLIDLPNLSDPRGGLVALESNQSIPFELKRIYYIFKTNDQQARGFHAHKNLKQIAICLQGSCKFILDNGHHKEEVIININIAKRAINVYFFILFKIRYSGKRGIRTPEPVLPVTRFPGVPEKFGFRRFSISYKQALSDLRFICGFCG